MTKRLAIIRSAFHYLDFKKYNCQELGLGVSLCENGWDVDLYLYGKEERKEIAYRSQDCDLTVYRLSAIQLLRQQAYYPRLLKSLSRKQYDLIQVHEESNITSVLVAKWAKRNDIPVILYQGMYENYKGLKGTLQTYYNLWALPSLRNSLHYSLAKTTSAQNYLEKLGLSPVLLLPVGLDWSHFHKSKQMENCELISFSKKFTYIMIYIGTLDKNKQPDFLIQVFQLISKKLDIGMILIGDGPEKEKTLSVIMDTGLSDRVYYRSSVPNETISCYYNQADLFLLPSVSEIYGMVLLESLYFGVPVITSDTAGAVDIITDQAHGYVLDSFDIHTWVDMCEKYLNKQTGNRELLKNYVETNYGWNAIAAQYISHYEKMIHHNESSFSE